MGERDYTFQLCEAEGMGVVAMFTEVVTSLTIVAVFACWAIPDSMARLELFTEAAAMGEWHGFR